jgi:ABC-2 type transport system ATP-binding protein
MPMNDDQLVVSARGLSKNFGSLQAVRQVDLEIRRGIIYGFLGPNGSGKSTTIRMLCGLLTPSSGEGTVLGLDIRNDSEQLKQKIGYMTQRFALYDDLTVKENLQFISEIYAIPGCERKLRVGGMLERFNLESQAQQRAGTLSGGQRQRLALAASILHKPELVFLDEPTSAVDPQNRRDFWKTLFELAETGTTVMVSTHYMDEAERCHRLAILHKGVKVADGTPRELGDAIHSRVIEVIAEDSNHARQVLSKISIVSSVTQLGMRLRVLVPKNIANPEQLLREELTRYAVNARLETVIPNLEDVFVAVTDLYRQEH